MPDSVICGKSGLDHFRCMRKHPARFRKASANSARLRLFISGHPLFFSLIPFRELTVKLELAKQLNTQRIAGPANKRHAFQAIHIHSPAHEVGLSNKRGRGPKPKP